MNDPFISVIIPNYCHSKYLDERIHSVLNQSYQNFELIILDDCSPDNGASKAVIEKYRDNPHVKCIMYNEVNSGSTFKQWCKGIEVAIGEYIWIAESDDYCAPTMLEELVNVCVNDKDVVLAYTTSTLVDQDGSILFRPIDYSTKIFQSPSYIKKFLLLYNFVQNASSAIFKREIAIKIDKQYADFKGAGDYMFWVEIALNGSVAVVNKGLNFFRRHSDVVTSKRESDGTNFREEMKILNYIQSRIPLNKMRLKYAYVYRMAIITKTSFINEEVKDDIYELWRIQDNDKSLYRFILRIALYIRIKYNYFI